MTFVLGTSGSLMMYSETENRVTICVTSVERHLQVGNWTSRKMVSVMIHSGSFYFFKGNDGTFNIKWKRNQGDVDDISMTLKFT